MPWAYGCAPTQNYLINYKQQTKGDSQRSLQICAAVKKRSLRSVRVHSNTHVNCISRPIFKVFEHYFASGCDACLCTLVTSTHAGLFKIPNVMQTSAEPDYWSKKCLLTLPTIEQRCMGTYFVLTKVLHILSNKIGIKDLY